MNNQRKISQGKASESNEQHNDILFESNRCPNLPCPSMLKMAERWTQSGHFRGFQGLILIDLALGDGRDAKGSKKWCSKCIEMYNNLCKFERKF